MPGATNNTNLLAGINQTIQAINDLITNFACPDVTVTTPAPVVNVYVNCGGTGAGGTGAGGGPIIEPEPGPDDTGTIPAGFPEDWTYNDYLAYKCKAANKIVADLIQTCWNLTSIGGVAGIAAAALWAFVNTSLLSGVLVGLMVLGFSAATAAAIVITALVALIVAGGAGLAYFGTLANSLEEVQQEMVCDLYNADSVEVARQDTEAHIDNAISGIIGIDEFASDQLNKVVKALMGYAVYNVLTTYNEEVSAYVGLVDCGGCNENQDVLVVTMGNLVSHDTINQTFVITEESVEGENHFEFHFGDGEEYTGFYLRVTPNNGPVNHKAFQGTTVFNLYWGTGIYTGSDPALLPDSGQTSEVHGCQSYSSIGNAYTWTVEYSHTPFSA